MSLLTIKESLEMTTIGHRFCMLASALAVCLCSMAAGSSGASAAPVLEVTSFHAPTSFQSASSASYRFWVHNVGDEAVDQQRSDNGTPDDSSDDSFGAPVTIDVDLPDGVTTRLGGIAMPYFGEPFDALLDSVARWECGSAAAGASSLSCRLQPDRLEPGQMVPLAVWVSTPSSPSGGTLDAEVSVTGGGADTVTHVEAAPMGPNVDSFGIAPGTFEADAFDRTGKPERQAGSHPWRAVTGFEFNLEDREGQDLEGGPTRVAAPVGSLRNVDVTLPRGFVGDPTAVEQCTVADFLDLVFAAEDAGQGSRCPVGSQVGIVYLTITALTGPGSPPSTVRTPLYSTVPRDGALAQFSFQFAGRIAHITAHLDPTDYSIVTRVRYANDELPVHRVRVSLWGVPADPAHDGARFTAPDGPLPERGHYGVESPLPVKPFLTLPSECGVADSTALSGMDSWQRPGVFAEPVFSEPAEAIGCEDPRIVFEPEMEVRPTTVAPDAPTGLEVDLRLPQTLAEFPNGSRAQNAANAKKFYDENGNMAALAVPPLKRAVVTLPEGMSINPAAADGLQACSDDRLRLGTDLGLKEGEPSCPEGSKIGSVTAISPVLEDSVEGGVYIRSQNSFDPESGEMFRLALILKDVERGLHVKLPGSVKADLETGRLVATFDENPQLPVERIKLSLKSGPRAPLATPATCGEKTTTVELTSWGGQRVETRSSFTIPCPAGQGFAPSFTAGSVNPTGGAFSPLMASIDRPERDQYLSRVDADLPKGLIAKLRGVELCPDAVAGDGTTGACPEGSRIGTATVGAGSGNPFFLQGPVYLTGPYGGAPYGLSVQVPAKAGPFDLGVVKVRNALRVNPETAQVSVASDRLPQIVKGVPVRLRSVNVDVDRPGFTINPTSCSEKRIVGTLTSIGGKVHGTASRFQVGDCRSLAFSPRIALRLTGRKHTRTGGHPGVRAVVAQRAGQANIKAVQVALPRSIVLDPSNTVGPKLICDYDLAQRADCPASSIIGRAVASTPVLDRPLSGPVHLVQGIRFGPRGNRIRSTPHLLVKLRGEVAINLRATTNTDTRDRLLTTFSSVPDAPVSRFSMRINGGRKGILVVTRTRVAKIDLCASPRSHLATAGIRSHSGKQRDFGVRVATPCALKRKAAPKRRR